MRRFRPLRRSHSLLLTAGFSAFWRGVRFARLQSTRLDWGAAFLALEDRYRVLQTLNLFALGGKQRGKFRQLVGLLLELLFVVATPLAERQFCCDPFLHLRHFTDPALLCTACQNCLSPPSPGGSEQFADGSRFVSPTLLRSYLSFMSMPPVVPRIAQAISAACPCGVK